MGQTAAQLEILLETAAAAGAGNQAEVTPHEDYGAGCTSAANQGLDATCHRSLSWA